MDGRSAEGQENASKKEYLVSVVIDSSKKDATNVVSYPFLFPTKEAANLAGATLVLKVLTQMIQDGTHPRWPLLVELMQSLDWRFPSNVFPLCGLIFRGTEFDRMHLHVLEVYPDTKPDDDWEGVFLDVWEEAAEKTDRGLENAKKRQRWV